MTLPTDTNSYGCGLFGMQHAELVKGMRAAVISLAGVYKWMYTLCSCYIWGVWFPMCVQSKPHSNYIITHPMWYYNLSLPFEHSGQWSDNI